MPFFFAHGFNLTHPPTQHNASDHTNTYSIHSNNATRIMYADCLPGARVTVSVAGEEAVEYETENEPLKATTFIEATPGARFAVVLELGEKFSCRDVQDSIEFRVKLDGQTVRSKVISARTHRPWKVDGTVDNVDGVNMLRTFEFAEHETSMYRMTY